MNQQIALKDDALLRGIFELKVYRKGQLVEDYVDNNLILGRMKDVMAGLIGGAPSYAGMTINQISFGTNGTAPTPGDNAVTSPFTKNLGAPTYPAAGRVSFPFILGTGEANGKAIREFALRLSDGTYAARKVRGVIEKDADLSFSGTWTILF